MSKVILASCLLALAASANAQATCGQLQIQLQQLNQQTTQTQSQAAACAAGGNLEPYNPTWAPYPIHSWPDSGTGSCKQMQAHATYIQTENDAQIAQIQNTMNQMNC